MQDGADPIEEGHQAARAVSSGSRAPIVGCLVSEARREDPVGMLASPVRVRLE
jgi:hypothetical protein